MKNISIITLIFVIIISCSSNKEKRLIEKFLNEIILNDSFRFIDSRKFVEYNDLDSQKERMISFLINENIKLLRENLIQQESYRVLTHKQFLESDIDFKFLYSDYSKVYYVVGNNDKVIATIVFGTNKIISFSYNIIKNKGKPKTPLLLNIL